MRVLQILLIILSFAIVANATSDCPSRIKIYVQDSNGKTLKQNAVKVELIQTEEIKTRIFYEYSNAHIWHKFRDNRELIEVKLKVSGKDFKSFEETIKFPHCDNLKALQLRLPTKKSKKKAILERLANLRVWASNNTGYDVEKVKIVVTDKSGEKFTVNENTDVWGIDLKSGNYTMVIYGIGDTFLGKVKDFRLEPKTNKFHIKLEVDKSLRDFNQKLEYKNYDLSESETDYYTLLITGPQKILYNLNLVTVYGYVTYKNTDNVWNTKIILTSLEGKKYYIETNDGYFEVDVPNGKYKMEFAGNKDYLPAIIENKEFMKDRNILYIVLRNKLINKEEI